LTSFPTRRSSDLGFAVCAGMSGGYVYGGTACEFGQRHDLATFVDGFASMIDKGISIRGLSTLAVENGLQPEFPTEEFSQCRGVSAIVGIRRWVVFVAVPLDNGPYLGNPTLVLFPLRNPVVNFRHVEAGKFPAIF